jgi:very-short-patch-repair endonuclease
VHRAVFVAHNATIAIDQREWIAALAVGRDAPALLGGRSALRALGLKGFASDRIDVIVPAGRRANAPPAGVLVHRTTLLPPEDVHHAGMPPCTAPGRSVVDAASWARSDREACTVIAMAFQQRLVFLRDVTDALRHMPRARRRHLTLLVAGDAAGGSHSLAELDLATLMRKASLPLPSLQEMRVDAAGRRRYLDVYFAEWGLHVEIDGAHHDDPVQAWADMDRQNDLWRPGERVLRFPSWLVRAHPDVVIAHIHTALRQQGWRG